MYHWVALCALWAVVARTDAGMECTNCIRARGDQMDCNDQGPASGYSVICGNLEVCSADVRCDRRGRLLWSKGCQKRGSVSKLNEPFCNTDGTRCFFYCNGTDFCNNNVVAEVYKDLPCVNAEKAVQNLISEKQGFFNTRDSKSFAATYHRDAIVYPHLAPPVRGIRDIYKRFVSLVDPGKKVDSRVVDFHPMGDMFVSSATCYLRVDDDGVKPRGFGKSLYIYIWDPDTKNWLIWRHMFNGTPAPGEC